MFHAADEITVADQSAARARRAATRAEGELVPMLTSHAVLRCVGAECTVTQRAHGEGWGARRATPATAPVTRRAGSILGAAPKPSYALQV